jgi:chromosome partitioning protein
MRKIISIANQKGGVGKTTTAINLAASLASAEQRTLLIDCDSQGNASTGVGMDRTQVEGKNIYHSLVGQVSLGDIIRKTPLPYLDVAPADQNLIGVEIEFVAMENREKKLRNLLYDLKKDYSFIIIDCPPSLGFLTINALVASDYLIVPLQCEYFAMEGLGNLLNTLRLVRKSFNPTLNLGGILLTMFDARNLLAHRVSEDVRKHFGNKVFDTIIPRNVRLSESPSHGLPIILYDIKSRGAVAYMDLAREIMKNGRL